MFTEKFPYYESSQGRKSSQNSLFAVTEIKNKL